MRPTITAILFVLVVAGAFLWLRHRPDGSSTQPYSDWDAEMDEFGPRLNEIGPDEIGVYPAMPYFFYDFAYPAFGQPIPSLPENHPLTMAQAHLSDGNYGLAARTALGSVGPAGEDYDPGRPECRAAAAMLAALYTEPEHVPILPLGLHWLGTVVGDHNLRTMYSERSVAHSQAPRCTIHCYRLQRADIPSAESQPLAFVLRNGDDFVGAFCVERNEQTGFFELKLLDHEGLPLVVDKLGPEMPDETAILGFVQDFTPTYRRDVGVYSIMRAEVESLLHSRNEVTPLAARWAAYARFRREGQEHDRPPSEIATRVRDELRARRAWAWKIESDERCAYRDDPRDGERFPAYRMQGYRNMSLEGFFAAGDSKLIDCEHYHFTVFSTATAFPRHEYVFSYRLMSRIQGGTRQFALEHLQAGIPMWIESYDESPSFEEVRAAVTNHLEMNN